jgi:UDP-N-acetylglucosamine acyltransferase
MISSLADIHPSAKIGKNVRIGPFTTIGEFVEIGDNCIINANVVVTGWTKIGKGNHIFQFCSIGETPQDINFKGEQTFLEIGDNNIIREYTQIHLGTEHGGGITKIGNNNFIMVCVHIGHDCLIGDNNIIVGYTSMAGHVTIGNYVNLSGYTLVPQFLSIGSYAYTTMNTAVTKNIPPFVWVAGNKVLKINKVGLQRRGFSEEEVKKIQNIYKVFFRKKLKLEAAMTEIKNIAKGCEKSQIFVDFVEKYKTQKAGIIRR